ncbi:MAG: hypothetical protein RBT86_06275 [Azospira sp.]|jgi:hypothetical protein|nr:hypothetical protein [Azospira sp.]
MENANGFKAASRHFAVQTLFNACYAETLQVAARVLRRDGMSCDCRPVEKLANLEAQGLLPPGSLDTLYESCTNCRRTLDKAADAYESGDAEALRVRLREYRQAAGAVRDELIRLAG